MLPTVGGSNFSDYVYRLSPADFTELGYTYDYTLVDEDEDNELDDDVLEDDAEDDEEELELELVEDEEDELELVPLFQAM